MVMSLFNIIMLLTMNNGSKSGFFNGIYPFCSKECSPVIMEKKKKTKNPSLPRGLHYMGMSENGVYP